MVQWSELRAFTERPGSIPGEEMRSPQAVWHGQEKKSLIIESEVTQSCPTLCNPTDCGPTRLLPSMEFSRQEYWSGLPFPTPGESSWPRNQTRVSHIAGRCFTIWATREVNNLKMKNVFLSPKSPCKISGLWLQTQVPSEAKRGIQMSDEGQVRAKLRGGDWRT